MGLNHESTFAETRKITGKKRRHTNRWKIVPEFKSVTRMGE
jgi:hypothetical protein